MDPLIVSEMALLNGLGWRIVQPQPVAAHGYHKGVFWVDFSQPVSQAADQRIQGLFGDVHRIFLPPDPGDQLFSRYNSAFVFK